MLLYVYSCFYEILLRVQVFLFLSLFYFYYEILLNVYNFYSIPMAWAHDASLVKYGCVYTFFSSFFFHSCSQSPGFSSVPLEGNGCREHERITLWTSQVMVQHEQ